MQSSQTGEASNGLFVHFNLERAARRNISRYLDICARRLAVGFQRRGKRDNEARDRLCERQRPDGAISCAVGRRNRDRVLGVRKRREGISGNGKRLRCAQRDRVLRRDCLSVDLFNNVHRVAVRIGYAVLIGEIPALRAKIGVTAGNHGRLVMDYGNISACGVRGIIAVAVLCADAVF